LDRQAFAGERGGERGVPSENPSAAHATVPAAFPRPPDTSGSIEGTLVSSATAALRVLAVVPFEEEDESPFVGLLKIEVALGEPQPTGAV
jgi:hypothetical protein